MNLDRSDSSNCPEESQLSRLDIQEVKKVSRGVQQSFLIQYMKVVAPRAVISQTVTESEGLGGEVAGNGGTVVNDGFLLLFAAGVHHSLRHVLGDV